MTEAQATVLERVALLPGGGKGLSQAEMRTAAVLAGRGLLERTADPYPGYILSPLGRAAASLAMLLPALAGQSEGQAHG